MDEFRNTLFKYRGWLFVPLAIIIVIFARPTVFSFAIGGFLAFLGELLRIWGVGYSGITTRDSKVIAPELVTAGPYAYTRNPLYIGNFITAMGFLVIASGGWGISVWFRCLIYFFVFLYYYYIYINIIICEEKYLLETFKEDFAEYCREVPRLFPKFSPHKKTLGKFKLKAILFAESQTFIMFVILFAIFVFQYFRFG